MSSVRKYVGWRVGNESRLTISSSRCSVKAGDDDTVSPRTLMEPDDIQIRHLAWEDLYIPELVEAALATVAQYEDWELEIQIRAHAVYCANFLNPN